MRVASLLLSMQVCFIDGIVDDLLQQLSRFPVIFAVTQFWMVVLEPIDRRFDSVFGLLGESHFLKQPLLVQLASSLSNTKVLLWSDLKILFER